jgi:FkbM family methyltransferase
MGQTKSRIFQVLQRIVRTTGMDLQPPIAPRGGVGEMLATRDVDVVLDIGAAVGMYGKWIRHAGYKGPIHSFEPMSTPFKKLQKTAAGDPLWDVRQMAMGAEVGSAEINIAGNSDSSSMLPMEERHAQAAPESVYIGTETVQVGTIDSMWDELVGDAKKPFVKLDVQGFEREALKGATEHLPQIYGIQLELSLVPLYEGGPLWEEMIEFVKAQGFEFGGIEQGYTDPATGEMLQADGIFLRV